MGFAGEVLATVRGVSEYQYRELVAMAQDPCPHAETLCRASPERAEDGSGGRRTERLAALAARGEHGLIQRFAPAGL